MALRSCPDCGNQVSTLAPSCPSCGHPFAPPPIPPPAPPHIPPPQPIIIHAPQPQKKGIGLVRGLLIVLGILVLIPVIGGMLATGGAGSSTSAPSPRTPTPKEQAKGLVGISTWSWHKTAGGSLMEATFTITNTSPYDIKDIEIKCVHSGPSSTRIDSNTRTIYEVIKAGHARTFTDFDMGFIHSQAVSSSATIKEFSLVR